MKIINVIIGLALLISVTSCDDFLDVRPKSEKLESDLFKDADGFEAAIYGVYGSLQIDSLYGMFLQFGVNEVLSQTMGSYLHPTLDPLGKYDYTHENVKPLFRGIWTNAYQTIGYANNILEQLKKWSPASLPLYNYYKGEMLGIRAMLHFDMLCMFAPTDMSQQGIPYVTAYSYSVKPFYKVGEVYDFILKDLIEAESLLQEEANVIVYPHVNKNAEKFLNYRETHFNIYAVWGELARVYWMKGDMKNAAIYARKVIDSGKFPLVSRSEIKDYLTGVLSPKETIFGVYSTGFLEICKTYLVGLTSYQTYLPYAPDGNTMFSFQDLYKVDIDNSSADFRLGHFVSLGGDSYNFYKLVDYFTLTNKSRNSKITFIDGITLMHTSELYLIAAEALLETDYDLALDYFDTEISSRGLTGFRQLGKTLTKENIYNEYCKELFGEGRIWYNMKRLNKTFISNVERVEKVGSDKIYVVPIPDEEYEYRNE